MNISSFSQELSRVVGGRFPPPSRYQWRRYSVAVLAVAIALLLKLLLNPVIQQESPFLTFFGAVLVSAHYGGMRAGVLATFLAALISNYFFLSPAYTFVHRDLGQTLRLFIFVIEGIAISKTVASLDAAKRRANLSKQEALHYEKLHHEQSLHQNEERFRLLIQEVKDYAIFTINLNGQISSWNVGGENIFGYPEAEIIGQDLSCIFTDADIQSGQPKRELQTAMALGQAYEEAHHVRQDGTIFWASGVVTALRDEAGNMRGFSKVVRDITERKQAEEARQEANDDLEVKVEHRTTELRNSNKDLQSEIVERQKSEEALRLSDERLRLALQVNQAGTWDWDMVTNKITWCPEHELLFGLTPGTFDGTHETILKGIHPEDRQLVTQALARAIKSSIGYDQEYRIVWSDATIHWLAVKGKVFYDCTDQAVRMVGLSVDITNLKQTTEQIAASLKEKEVLLKEIHHRVKNNLQIISSLLNLQAGYIEDQKTIEIFKQCENRVASMALIHEQLYQSHDLAKIDFAEYVKTLTANLLSSYDIHSDAEDESRAEGIALLVDVDNVFLSVDAAIPCGLIINELVSNSLKYAFLPGKKGEICISTRTDANNHVTLTISDNGIGFPEDLDFKNTESLGFQIVIALTNQLEGTIKLNRNNGTEFEIKF